MTYLLHAFRRRTDGSWLCIATTWLSGPNGRIHVDRGSVLTPGTTIEGVDVAAWLEDAARANRG